MAAEESEKVKTNVETMQEKDWLMKKMYELQDLISRHFRENRPSIFHRHFKDLQNGIMQKKTQFKLLIVDFQGEIYFDGNKIESYRCLYRFILD